MTENTGFLDEGYEIPKGESDYIKLEDGENRIRILSKPLIGWSYWNKDTKPVRIAGIHKPEIDKSLINKDKFGFQDCTHFWALVIFDYRTNKIKVFECTQPGIQKRIKELAQNVEWGNPFGYDLTINKTKEGGKTKYSVTPMPPKPVSDAVKAAYKARPCNLNALLVNGNPFDVNGAPAPSAEAMASIPAPVATSPRHDDKVSLVPDPVDDLPF